MAKLNDGIIALAITVSLRDNPVFSVQAGDDAVQPGQLPLFCNGFGNINADLFKEILGKIIASYPNSPISLCVEGSTIIPKANCAPSPVSRSVPAGDVFEAVETAMPGAAAAADMHVAEVNTAAPRSLAPQSTLPGPARSKTATPRKAALARSTLKKAAAKKAAPKKAVPAKASSKKAAVVKRASKPAAPKKADAKRARSPKGGKKPR
jgi:hypothetical protein